MVTSLRGDVRFFYGKKYTFAQFQYGIVWYGMV